MKKILFIFTLFFFTGVNAQTMYVRPLIGSQTSYPVSNIQKLTFENGNLIVSNISGSNGTFVLAENRYINFTDLTLGTNNPVATENKFYLFPNPSNQWLNIANLIQNQTPNLIEIISIEGKLLMHLYPTSADSQIDISALPQGIYLCKITSNNELQTLKFLKQ